MKKSESKCFSTFHARWYRLIRCAVLTFFILLNAMACSSTMECDFGFIMKSELRKVVTTAPSPPAPGFGVIIGGSFDDWLKRAPILDREANGFHEGNAFYYFENFAKSYTVTLQNLTSPQFRKFMTSHNADLEDIVEITESSGWLLFDTDAVSKGLSGLRKTLSDLKSFNPQNQHDKFAQRFAITYFSDWVRLAEIALEADGYCRSLRNESSRGNPEGAHVDMRELVKEVRLMIYRPSVTPRDVPRRLAMWKTLKEVLSETNMPMPSQ